MQLGHAADHSPLSSTEVLEEWSYLYLYSLLGHNWTCNGVTLPFTSKKLFVLEHPGACVLLCTCPRSIVKC
jgi:hypothetical protein